MATPPHNVEQWFRKVERELAEVRRNSQASLVGYVNNKVGDIQDQVNDIDVDTRIPTAPIEIVSETFNQETFNDKVRRGYLTVSFPPVTKATDGTDIQVGSYEMWIRIAGDPNASYYLSATSIEPTLTSDSLDYGQTYEVIVRALTVTKRSGNFSEIQLVTITGDDPPPPMPSQLVATQRLGTVHLEWNGLSFADTAMPVDLSHTEVGMRQGAEVNYTPIGDRFNEAGFVYYSNAPFSEQVTFSHRAYDYAGGVSDWAQGTPITVDPVVDTSGLEQRLTDAETLLNNTNTDLQETKQELNTRLGDAETTLSNNSTALGTLQNTTIPALNTRLGEAETELNTTRTELDGRLDTAFVDIGAAQNAADKAKEYADSIAKSSPSTNMVPDPSFEYGVSHVSDTLSVGGASIELGSFEWLEPSTGAHDGSMVVRAYGSTGDFVGAVVSFDGDGARDGIVVDVSAWFYIDPANVPNVTDLNIQTIAVDETGAVIAGIALGSTTSISGGWNKVAVKGDNAMIDTPLPDGWSMVIALFANSGAPEIYIDQVSAVDVTRAARATKEALDAQALADSAMTMAGSKSVVTYSLSAGAPSFDGENPGDTHRQVVSSGDVVAEWRWSAGGVWVSQQLSSEVISNLDVGKLTVGTAAISTAVIDELWANVVRSRKITTDMLLVGGNGDNLIKDPMFTDNTLNAHRQTEANRIYDAGWYWAGTFWYSMISPPDGQYRMWFPNNLEPAGASGYDTPVTQGITYRFQCDAFLSGTGSADIMATMRTKNRNGSIGYAFISGTYTGADNWKTYTWDWTPDSDDATAMPEIVFNNVTGVSRLAVRNPSFKPKVDGSLVVAGSITGDHVEANSVAAKVGEFIELNVSQLTATTATMSTAVIDKLWADVVNAKKITADMMVIGAGNNLIPNAQLKNINGNATADGWESGWGLNTSNGPSNQPSIWLQGRVNRRSQPFPVQEGQRYRFEVKVQAQNAGSRIYIQLNLTGSSTNPYLVSNAVIPQGSWGTFSGEVTIPAGASSGYLNIYGNHPNGTDTAGYQWFTGWELFPMSDGQLIVNGAVTATHITASSSLSAKVGQFLTVTTSMLEANAVKAGNIDTGAITAAKIAGGAIDGKLITGATIRTSSSSTRLQMDSSGIQGLVSGAERLNISSSTGVIRVTAPTGTSIALEPFESVWGDGGRLIMQDLSKSVSTRGITKMEQYSAGSGMRIVHEKNGTEFARLSLSDSGGSLGSSTAGNGLLDYGLLSTTSYARLQGGYGTGNKIETTANGTTIISIFGGSGFYDSSIIQDFRKVVIDSSNRGRLMSLGGDSGADGNDVKFPGVYSEAYSGTANVSVSSTGWLTRVTSALKYKLDVQDIGEAYGDKILEVGLMDWIDKGASERLTEAYTPHQEDEEAPTVDPDLSIRRVPGVVAEHVKAAGLDQFVTYGPDGEIEGVMYDRLGVALIPVVRRQRDRITELENTQAEILARLSALEMR